jgi:hypothetical protein
MIHKRLCCTAFIFVSVLLCRLQRLHVLQLRAPYVVPEFTCDAEAVYVSKVKVKWRLDLGTYPSSKFW